MSIPNCKPNSKVRLCEEIALGGKGLPRNTIKLWRIQQKNTTRMDGVFYVGATYFSGPSACQVSRTAASLTDLSRPWVSIPNSNSDKKRDTQMSTSFVLALPIFPGRLQPSIVGRSELNFRVRDGNGWTLALISTNYSDVVAP